MAASSCCCGISSFCARRPQTLDVACGFHRGRFLLALTRLRGDQVRVGHRDFVLGDGHRRVCRLDAARRGRDAGAGLDARDRHAALRRAGRRRRVRQFRARAIDRHLVVARIDLHQHGAAADRQVVVHMNGNHGAAHARGDLRNLSVHLRIVGGLPAVRAPPHDRADDENHRKNCRTNPPPSHY